MTATSCEERVGVWNRRVEHAARSAGLYPCGQAVRPPFSWPAQLGAEEGGAADCVSNRGFILDTAGWLRRRRCKVADSAACHAVQLDGRASRVVSAHLPRRLPRAAVCVDEGAKICALHQTSIPLNNPVNWRSRVHVEQLLHGPLHDPAGKSSASARALYRLQVVVSASRRLRRVSLFWSGRRLCPWVNCSSTAPGRSPESPG